MAKTRKDREGNYHPPKGMPSGEGHVKGITEVQTAENYDTIYIDDPEDLPGDVHIRHPNRNEDKRETRGRKKEATAIRKGHAAAAAETARGVSAQEIDGMDPETFRQLANHTAPVCISIFLPTHAAGAAVNEKMDTIAFKNALQQVTEQLKTKGMEAAQIQTLLAPAYSLIQEDSFWNDQQHGLACFLADGFCRYARLPITPSPYILCNRAFYLSPLIPWTTAPEKFYLLVLSKKQAQVYRGDAFGMRRIPMPDLPNGIEDVVHLEEKDDQQLFRTGSSGAGKGANYHGIGGGKPDEKQNIQLYLEEVERTLRAQLLGRENCPLLLAGVGYLLPLFRQSTQYKNVWPESLTGNFEYTHMPTLYKEARQTLEPYFQERRKRALEEFQNKSATALTTSIPEDIIPAAYYGQVSTLFIRKDRQLWGQFDEASNQLSIHSEPEQEDEPLIDKAVIKTLMNGGDVFEIDTAQLAQDTAMAAILRY